MSIILPLVIIFLEWRGINFSDLLITTCAKFLITIGKEKEAKSANVGVEYSGSSGGGGTCFCRIVY
jgi:hypothetical protein